jgi:hypothetical protein
MQVDIIYSLTCHESPDSFADTLENIKYFNKGHRIAIIVNTNQSMHSSVKEDDIARIVPMPWTKKIYTKDIFKAHLENYKYSRDNNITSTYFIMLASNCMFHRMITLQEIQDGVASTPMHDVTLSLPRPRGWWWPKFYRNEKVISICEANNIRNYVASQHEGMIVTSSDMDKIYTFTIEKQLLENFTHDVVVEEIIPGTLYAYFTGRKPYHICKVFWDLPNYTPTIQHIQACELPCVKRVERSLTNPVRQWLRQLRMLS